MDKKTLFDAGFTTLAGKTGEEETAVGGEIKMDKKTLFEAGYTTLAGKSNEEETAVGGERLARIAMENLAADLARKIHSLVEMARAGQGTSPWLDDDALKERVKELRGKFYKLAAEAEDLLRDVLGAL